MFKIHKSKAGYVAELESTGDTYFCGHVQPTAGYPKKSKYPYKTDLSLIKDKKFIRLSKQDAAARSIYSAVIPELCQFIQREQAMEDEHQKVRKQQQDILDAFEEDAPLYQQTLNDILD